MRFTRSAIPLVEQYFASKLAQVEMLTIHFVFDRPDQATIQATINFCINWLTSEERDSTEPRLLSILICGAGNFQQFVMAVRQQFLSSKSPCTFAIGFFFCDIDNQVANFHLENDLGEQLDGQFDEDGDFGIRRHKKVDSAREQLNEWAVKTAEKSDKSSGIGIYWDVTIGQIDANSGIDEVDENAGEEDEPSTSG